jgi:hypothetical protein
VGLLPACVDLLPNKKEFDPRLPVTFQQTPHMTIVLYLNVTCIAHCLPSDRTYWMGLQATLNLMTVLSGTLKMGTRPANRNFGGERHDGMVG